MELWPGHPLEVEVYGALQRFRVALSDLRERAASISQEQGVPDAHSRVVIYVGQYLVQEGSDDNEEPSEPTE